MTLRNIVFRLHHPERRFVELAHFPLVQLLADIFHAGEFAEQEAALGFFDPFLKFFIAFDAGAVDTDQEFDFRMLCQIIQTFRDLSRVPLMEQLQVKLLSRCRIAETEIGKDQAVFLRLDIGGAVNDLPGCFHLVEAALEHLDFLGDVGAEVCVMAFQTGSLVQFELEIAFPYFDRTGYFPFLQPAERREKRGKLEPVFEAVFQNGRRTVDFEPDDLWLFFIFFVGDSLGGAEQSEEFQIFEQPSQFRGILL